MDYTLLKFLHVLGAVLTGVGVVSVWLTRQALEVGHFTEALEQERAKLVPAYTHFLDIPAFILLIALGTLKPQSWSLWAWGVVRAASVAACLTYWIPRMYPWGSRSPMSRSTVS